jgi:hypothetical protein
MSIKYLNPKSYGQVYQKLVNGYRKVKGKDPSGLDLIKIKLEAAEQIRNSEKIIKFPEEKITPFYEERPSKGPQADVKKFPTKNKPAAQTYSSDFLDLLEEFNKISKNQPSLAEITGVSNKYPEKTGIVKSTIELLESKDPKSLSRELQKIMKREGTYVDYSDEEVAQILNGFESRTKNKIKPAEEIINEGDFDPSGFAGGGLAYMLGEPVRMFKGGRIGYSIGAGKKGVQGLLDLVKNKFGKKSITTADKIARPEKAITKEMFDAFNKRLKEKTKSYKQGDPITSENFGDTSFAPDMTGLNKAREMDDDIVKFRTENPAGKGRFTKAEVIITRLKNTIQGAKNNPDETSDYVLKNFPNMIEELKNKPELANNENVFQTLAVEGLPKNQRLKVYDDGTVDFETLKPTHQFKLREDIKRKLNAEGGQMDEIKDEGLETQKTFTVTDYEEATVRPDAEGKMKDVDFYVDEADHKELQKIVDEEKNKFKSGGLAYMLGE